MINAIYESVSVNICFFLFVYPQLFLAYFFTKRSVVTYSIRSPTSLLTLAHINLILLSEYLFLHSLSPLDSLFDCICVDLNLGLNGVTEYCSLRQNEGVWRGERITAATAQRYRHLVTWVIQTDLCTDHCRMWSLECRKTVGVAESFEVLLSNRPIVKCSVSVRLINVSDFSRLFDCVSNIIPLKVKFATYKLIYSNNCTSATR
jgi:hypothetical protein